MEDFVNLQQLMTMLQADPVLNTTGVLIIGGLILIKKFWRGVSEELVNSSQDAANGALLNSLVGDIERLHKEIVNTKESFNIQMTELKESHKIEKDELYTRIKHLEDTIQTLHKRHEDMRIEALDLYYYLSSDTTIDSVIKEELKDKIMKIIMYEAKSNETNK